MRCQSPAKRNSKRHGDVAVLGHLHILVHSSALIAEPDGGREDRQKHRNDGPGTCLHIDPMRSAARLFRAGDGSFLTPKGSNIFEWRLAELPFA
jgi:hypothetical protein